MWGEEGIPRGERGEVRFGPWGGPRDPAVVDLPWEEGRGLVEVFRPSALLVIAIGVALQAVVWRVEPLALAGAIAGHLLLDLLEEPKALAILDRAQLAFEGVQFAFQPL